MTLNIGSINIF